jgi:hypothetical protein
VQLIVGFCTAIRQTACKPGSVRPVTRHDGHSSATRLAARLARPTRAAGRECPWRRMPRDFPGGCRRPPLFGLAPGGVCPAAAVAGGAVRSCRTISPLPAGLLPGAGGIFSVALSLGSPPPAVSRHRIPVEPGLSSNALRRQRPSGRLASFQMRKRAVRVKSPFRFQRINVPEIGCSIRLPQAGWARLVSPRSSMDWARRTPCKTRYAVKDDRMRARRGRDPTRRIAPPDRIDAAGREALAARLIYVGSALHKTKPGDYGFHPPVNPRPWKSICDGVRVVLLAEARDLFRRGIHLGMFSEFGHAGVPKYVWSVDGAGEAYEAKISPGALAYKGYRLEEEDAMRAVVLKEWAERWSKSHES